MNTIRAYRVHADGKFGAGRFDTMSPADLDAGSVVVRIAYASVNYKDARYKEGDEVIVHSFGLGAELGKRSRIDAQRRARDQHDLALHHV